jgi:hypothetical protein
MLEFIDLEVDGKKEITITLSFNGKIIKKSLEPKKFRPENRNIIMDGIAETVGIKTPKEIGMHFSFLPGETSVVITCEKGWLLKSS